MRKKNDYGYERMVNRGWRIEMMACDIMLDLEATDSNAKTAGIVSIGAVYFDIPTQTLGEKFYAEISIKGIQKQLDNGHTLSLSTMQWWLGQSEEARSVWFANGHEKHDIVNALCLFSEFCQRSGGRPKIWGNGVDYDNVCLRNCYETFNIGCPWRYSDNRCYRTMKNLFGHRAKLDREGTHHQALDDAITQAQHLLDMMKGIKGIV